VEGVGFGTQLARRRARTCAFDHGGVEVARAQGFSLRACDSGRTDARRGSVAPRTRPGVSVPNTFTDGTPAEAEEVNASFDALETRVNGNGSRITGAETAAAAAAAVHLVDSHSGGLSPPMMFMTPRPWRALSRGCAHGGHEHTAERRRGGSGAKPADTLPNRERVRFEESGLHPVTTARWNSISSTRK